jgi:SAM-dependent methyltransferase
MIRVEEREGLRLLTIDGVVQGAAPLHPSTPALAGDPIVELLLAAMPSARSALVIGLGTGRTAGELAQRGLDVEAVELEPLVVSYARRYFGYRGHAAVADGLEYLKRPGKVFDIVLLDAVSGRKPPPHLVTPSALTLVGRRLSPEGVAGVRLLQPPGPALLRPIRASVGPYCVGFAGGQNIYLLAARLPVSIVLARGVTTRPFLNIPDDELLASESARRARLESPSSQVTLVGYLVRLAEDGSLAVDLPHKDMGAVRFRLGGSAVEPLRALVARVKRFPTDGQIKSDGNTKATLKTSFGGGGGVMRSDIRFSPTLVALEGVVRFRAAVHADAVFAGLATIRGMPVEPLLPYGGILYELEVKRVIRSCDRATWDRVAARLRPLQRQALRALQREDLAAGARALGDYLKSLVGELDLIAERSQHAIVLSLLMRRLEKEAARVGNTAFSRAAACDRSGSGLFMHVEIAELGTMERSLLVALESCARRWYDKATADPDQEEARRAARRLLWIEEVRPTTGGKKTERAAERRAAALKKRFGRGLKGESDPPP